MNKTGLRGFVIGIALGVLLLGAVSGGVILERFYFSDGEVAEQNLSQKVLMEENVVIDVAEKVSPSVVTVSIVEPRRRVVEFNPFGGGFTQRFEGGEPQDIGTGFIVKGDGIIVTNKHVVSSLDASYKVVTQSGEEYEIKEINRDPANDLAVLKIDANNLPATELGSSDGLKVGQFVVAIGTALGEFRHTVTTGVISGLGRGITAGSVYEGSVERLDDVIQTDAAINPGNSGGPLLNSAGQVIGVNVAVAQGAENVGFAIPVDVLKKGLEEFNSNGKFASKPFLGVSYQMVSSRSAILNDVPQGAYVVEVVEGSAAEKAGIQVEDIITKLSGKELNEEQDLSDVISGLSSGDKVEIEIFRGGETLTLQATLSENL